MLKKLIYEEFDGWSEEVAKARSYDELPENAKKYLTRIEELTGTKISIVGVGPKKRSNNKSNKRIIKYIGEY